MYTKEDGPDGLWMNRKSTNVILQRGGPRKRLGVFGPEPPHQSSFVTSVTRFTRLSVKVEGVSAPDRTGMTVQGSYSILLLLTVVIITTVIRESDTVRDTCRKKVTNG